jgi:dTDP-4-dehydrorhamnose 3,5-epimerase-like enzyme
MNLADVRWIDITHRDDDRGTLTALEGSTLPFEIKRIFYMHRVPAGHDRGGHAHRYTQQCAIAVSGRVTIDASDGTKTEAFVLDDPNKGLYLPAMTWVRLRGFEPSTVALVLCDTAYNPQHVIRDWDEYCRLLREPSLAT